MKKTSTQINLLLLLLITSLGACFKGTTVTVETPVIITNDVIIEATGTSAWGGGFITNNVSNITAYGVCYSATNPVPTVADLKTTDNISLFSFNSNLKALTPNTVYYVRAYATNSATTAYGGVVQFKTGSGTGAVATVVSTLAGSTQGNANGNGTSALFNHPYGMATDATGNVYVSDSYNCTIRKITPAGDVTTIAGTGNLGNADGPGTTAQFYAPTGLAVDATGNIFVADMGNNLIRKIGPGGVVSTFAGNGSAGYTNGTGTAASFSQPTGIVIDAAGNLYVTDSGNNLVRKITQAGVVTTIAGSRLAGFLSGQGTAAAFNKPSGIALDAAGNMYVTEPLNKAIRKITKDYMVTTFTGGLASVSFAIGQPQAINIDANNNFFIADANGRILKIAADRNVTVLAGTSGTTGSADGSGTAALFNEPKGLAIDNQGNIYVADYSNNRIRKIK
jgi:sugar lactone lactonase YvrE